MSEPEASETIYLVSGCASLDDVVTAFRRHASLGTLFVPTPTPIRAMTRGRFALALRDGGIVIEGDAEVISETGSGMTLRFTDLDTDSAAMLHHLERVRFAARVPEMPPYLVVRVGPSGLTPPIDDDMATCAVIGRLPAPPDAIALPADVDLALGGVSNGTDTVQMFSSIPSVPPALARSLETEKVAASNLRPRVVHIPPPDPREPRDTLMDGRLLEAAGRDEPRAADQIDRALDPPGMVILSPSIQMDALPPASRPSLPGMPPPAVRAPALVPSPGPIAPPPAVAAGSTPLPRDLRQSALDEETILVRPAPRTRTAQLAIAIGLAVAVAATIIALSVGDDGESLPAPTVVQQPSGALLVEPPPTPAGVPDPSKSPSSCRATVSSSPSGASIVVGGKVLGKTPATVVLPCARTSVTLKRPRYIAATTTIDATAPGTAVKVALERPTFTLSVKSSPPGAVITVGGRKVGRTPTTVRVPGYERLVLKATKAGYATATKRVFLKRTGTTVKLALAKR